VAIIEARPWGATPWLSEALPKRHSRRTKPEVVVIGAGLTGLSAAYHLARRGVSVTVCEAGEVGSGASGRTGGLVLEGTARELPAGTERSFSIIEGIVREESIECGLAMPGCREIAHRRGDAGVRDGATMPWTDDGCAIEIVRVVPGGVVEPRALLLGLAKAAIRSGAEILEQTRVAPLTIGSSPTLEVNGTTIRPDHVIVAVNAWTGALLPQLQSVQGALTFACATEPLGERTLEQIGLEDAIPFYTVDQPYLWGRNLADGGVVFGAGLVFGTPAELERMSSEDREPRSILERLEARVRGLNPALANVRIAARWGGPVAFREGLAPILSRLPDSPRILVVGAYAGHGVALSVWAGELLSRVILDNAPLPQWGAL